ncbi:MAG TPA: hypothetical protein VNK92_02100, partial [Vicinamibacterales bacterium]|nr:hypothetical protein [Vicinamibacterales bacterium]
PAAALASRVLRGLLFGVEPGDPVVYAGVALLVAAAGLAACYLPARRAAGVAPAEVLRYE